VRGLALASAFLILLASAAGCGGSNRKAIPPPTTQSTTSPTPTAATTTPPSPGALQAEANAAAAGDIPDNQVFLVFENSRAGYAIKYPEGWAQQGTGNTVVFRDKNNIVRIVVASGGPPTAPAVRRDLGSQKGITVRSAPQAFKLPGGRAFKIVYSTESAPNAVTGKRVTLVVDRYYVWRAGRRAVVDLGTPQGVDNVDAYRLMIESFRWK
jgi:PsbP